MGSWNPRANEIFLRALEIASPEERGAYLAETCGEDAGLRVQINALLNAIERAGSFLESPAAEVAIGDPTPVVEGPGAVVGPYKLLQTIGEGAWARSTWPSRNTRCAAGWP